MTATKALFECRECEWSWYKWYEAEPSPWWSDTCPKCSKPTPIRDIFPVAITVSTKQRGEE